MEQNKENKMANTPMLKLILSMSVPAMFSMLVQALYNIVDSVYVSHYSPDALTALSLAFPIQSLIIAVGVGTGIGINSLVSRRLGEGRREEADKAASHGMVLGVINGLVTALLGILFTGTFFGSFQPTQTVFSMGCQYVYTVTICSLFVYVEINVEKTLQATGNMIYPMLFQLTGAIVNIILDPIMIFGYLGCPEMGVFGAALATVIGQFCALAFSVYVLRTKSHEVKINLRHFRFEGSTVKNIYQVGIPSIIMQSITAFLVTLLNGILIKFSEAAVSVLGVYFKLQSFVFMPVFGLTQGVMPIMGYSYGAKKKQRLVSALKIGIVFAIVIMAVGFAIFQLVPDLLLDIFKADPEVMRIGVPALKIISLSFIPAALGILFSTMFQAVGLGTRSLIVSVLRQLVLILPSAYLFARIGVEYVWYSFPLAEGVSFIVSVLLFWQVYRKYVKNLDSPLQVA
ncbi:MATE family efflux transporter [Feifania hominis]|uniref:MATE family efflux transporter n=1 Tax=Feifania hominis TaxID=2763660 RepID=A0A926HUK2_9FIRM|nr:MATE family efflux transporter [Feifania hominis]MBC8537004.1 MATE family efflux transporter [Feifania hominis]